MTRQISHPTMHKSPQDAWDINRELLTGGCVPEGYGADDMNTAWLGHVRIFNGKPIMDEAKYKSTRWDANEARAAMFDRCFAVGIVELVKQARQEREERAMGRPIWTGVDLASGPDRTVYHHPQQ